MYGIYSTDLLNITQCEMVTNFVGALRVNGKRTSRRVLRKCDLGREHDYIFSICE